MAMPAPPRITPLETGLIYDLSIRPEGGPPTLRLTTTNLCSVGARARLFRRTGDALEAVAPSFAFVGDDEPIPLNHPPAELAGLELHMRFRACAMSATFEKSDIALHIMQDNAYCAISSPARWERRIPACNGPDRPEQWPAILIIKNVELA